MGPEGGVVKVPKVPNDSTLRPPLLLYIDPFTSTRTLECDVSIKFMYIPIASRSTQSVLWVIPIHEKQLLHSKVLRGVHVSFM